MLVILNLKLNVSSLKNISNKLIGKCSYIIFLFKTWISFNFSFYNNFLINGNYTSLYILLKKGNDKQNRAIYFHYRFSHFAIHFEYHFVTAGKVTEFNISNLGTRDGRSIKLGAKLAGGAASRWFRGWDWTLFARSMDPYTAGWLETRATQKWLLAAMRDNDRERLKLALSVRICLSEMSRKTCWSAGSVPNLVLLHKSSPKEPLHHLALRRK